MSFFWWFLYWINHHSWLLFAYWSLCLIIAASVMAIHMVAHPSRQRYMWLLSMGAALAGVGCILAGMQAGENPIFPPAAILPWVRLAWTGGCTMLLVVCFMYIGKGHSRPY